MSIESHRRATAICQHRRAGAIRRMIGAAALALALVGLPCALWAQQAAPPMPDASAAGGPAPLYDSGAAGQPPDPSSAVEDPGDTAAVAIPGGGEVQAQGPAAPDSGVRIPPTETWSATRLDPNGSGTAPAGP
jgi:hypothetical protein